MIKILFILKFRGLYSTYNSYSDEYGTTYISSGLYNSARMVIHALEQFGINNAPVEAKMIQLNSYNLIDAEVFKYNPDIVILEAFWVPAAKVTELAGLWHHRKRKWIIRNHSEMPFLVLEQTPLTWIPKHLDNNKNIFIATNSTRSLIDLRDVVSEVNGWTLEQATERVIYFPNYYIIEQQPTWQPSPLSKPYIDIGCFGAIRPLKNHINQAIAAMRWAKMQNKILRFHINANRNEMNGNAILVGLRSIFSGKGNSELIEHDWMEHSDFIRVIESMDISMQVSFSETFNIVTADAVSMGVPVVVSHEIAWVDDAFKSSPTFTNDIVDKLQRAHLAGLNNLQNINLSRLIHFNRTTYSAIENSLEFVLFLANSNQVI